MSEDRNEARKRLERLCDALADDIDAMSDIELLSELEETGEDANAVAALTRALITDAISDAGRRTRARDMRGIVHDKTGPLTAFPTACMLGVAGL